MDPIIRNEMIHQIMHITFEQAWDDMLQADDPETPEIWREPIALVGELYADLRAGDTSVGISRHRLWELWLKQPAVQQVKNMYGGLGDMQLFQEYSGTCSTENFSDGFAEIVQQQ